MVDFDDMAELQVKLVHNGDRDCEEVQLVCKVDDHSMDRYNMLRDMVPSFLALLLVTSMMHWISSSMARQDQFCVQPSQVRRVASRVEGCA